MAHTLAGYAGSGGDAALALQVALDLALQLGGLSLVQCTCCIVGLQGDIVESRAAGGYGGRRLRRSDRQFRHCVSVRYADQSSRAQSSKRVRWISRQTFVTILQKPCIKGADIFRRG